MFETAHYHLAGVAGAGMSSLAEVLVAKGCRVTGSDRHLDAGRAVDVLDRLRGLGVGLYPQDGSGPASGARSLVVSTAIEQENPDTAAACRLGLPVRHRTDILAELVQESTCFGVTGTSGKSTVTGMIGWVLACIGVDPWVVNGAVLNNWKDGGGCGSVRCGGSDTWVLEVDESDRSLLKFSPDWAVVTNVSEDHFGIDETRELFRAFVARVRCGSVGRFVDPTPFDRLQVELSSGGSRFDYGGVEFFVPLPGRHNAENALCAVLLCEKLGVAPASVRDALHAFRGLRRRLECTGCVGGVTVFDDYAHNPAKLRAAWQAVRPHAERVLAVWRPHGFGPLAAMMTELEAMWAGLARPEDRVYMLPVYDAGGTADRSVESGELVQRLRARNVNAGLVNDYAAAAAAVGRTARPGDVVLSMGARDPGLSDLAGMLVDALR